MFKISNTKRPSTWRKYFDVGASHMAANRFKQALKAFEEAVELCDDNYWMGEIFYVCGGACMQTRDIDGAVDNFTEAIKYNPAKHTYYLTRGLCYQSLEEWAEAMDDYAQAVELGCEEIVLYIQRAQALLHLGIVEFAFQDMSEAQRLDPLNYNRLQLMINVLDDELARNPHDYVSYANRALAHQYSDNANATEADRRMAISLLKAAVPGQEIVYARSAQIRLLRGEYAEAISDCGRAIMLKSEFGLAYFLSASAHQNLGEIDEAIQLFTQCEALLKRQRTSESEFYRGAVRRRLTNLRKLAPR